MSTFSSFSLSLLRITTAVRDVCGSNHSSVLGCLLFPVPIRFALKSPSISLFFVFITGLLGQQSICSS